MRDHFGRTLRIAGLVVGSGLYGIVRSSAWDRLGHSRAVWEVANGVRAHSPDAAEIILNGGELDNQSLVSRTAIALLERAQTRSGDERSILKLAASLVIDRLTIDDVKFEGNVARLPDRPNVARLVALGDDVIRDAPNSWWGELAFVERLEGGWSRDCGDDYRDVIREGPAWLETHPRSPIAVRVMLAVGSNQAKASATEADAALGSYIRLLENIDTGQRRFFCQIP